MPPVELPAAVQAAYDRADDLGFPLSCEPDVGRLLAVLAAAVPPDGRVLELGTGVGVGLAWITTGLGDRDDVEVVSVELDAERAAVVEGVGWPPTVSIVVGDGAELAATLGRFDLVFPDAPGGKIRNLDATLAALRPGGMLLVDDMDLARHTDPDLRSGLQMVVDRLRAEPHLTTAELPLASGVVVATRSVRS
jgi:demethylmenaquinone methyltransferase/2-methoxy-6-polyprenyl-1,4-benzoquinol methylase